MKGLRANPGGNVAADQAIGREALALQCWDRLEMQSLRLENERRLGKTTVIRVMRASTPPRTRTILMEVGGLSSITDFIDELIAEIDRVVPETGKGFKARLRNVISGLAGFELGGVVRIPEAAKGHWRQILLECFEALAEATQDRVVFFWDEMPWMLQRIKKETDAEQVVDLLNSLRDIRQRYDRVRMVYTGSIGFHHVVADLEEEGIGSRPINDMKRVNVPPLAIEDSLRLSELLLIGESLDVADREATALALHEVTGGVPFYIHSIVADLRPGGKASPDLVRQQADSNLRDADDPWEMRYFDTRLDSYYKGKARSARIVLDSLARAEGPLPLASLHDDVRSALAPPESNLDEHQMRRLMIKLMQDHYVAYDETQKKDYVFKFPLLRRSWRIQRGLEG